MFRGDGVSGASWMPLRFWLLAAIIAVVVGTAAVVAYLSWNVRFTAEKALEVNWGLELPRGSEILEHHKEDSFQGRVSVHGCFGRAFAGGGKQNLRARRGHGYWRADEQTGRTFYVGYRRTSPEG